MQDVRYAVRTLRKSPVFTAVAVLSLALGIGANTAIFTLIHQLLLQPLPVRNPEQLVLLSARGRHYGSNTGSNAISYPMYTDFRDKNTVFSGMFCRHGMTVSVGYNGNTELIAAETVSGNYFPVLGVGAAVGRVFNASDDLIQGGHPVAVISYDYWKTRFSGDPNIIGRKITVNGYPLTIIGVSQQGFFGVEPGFTRQIRIPMSMQDDLPKGPFPQLNNRRRRFVQVFGRLKPGVTLDQGKAALQPLFHQILNMEVQEKAFSKASAEDKQAFLKMWMDVLPASKGRSQLRQQFGKPLWALMAIVGMVLLIACSNLANLLIARASSRQKEIAVRLALGAARRRLIRQLLTESVLLSALGGVLGLLLASVMDSVLVSLMPAQQQLFAISPEPNSTVLAFTAAVTLLTALMFGLVPALQATRPRIAATLKDQASSVVSGGSATLRKTLVTAQVALSLLLLIGAGLFFETLRNLKDLSPGFETTNLIQFSVEPTLSGYNPEWARDYYRRLTDRVKSVPGVSSMTLAVVSVLADDEWDNGVVVEGYTPSKGEHVDPHMQYCSPAFFQTLKIPILLGRDFNIKDDNGAPKVGIVNQKFAKRYFGSASPLGRRLGMGIDPGTKLDIEIVGVVGDTKYENMREEIPYELYIPFRQADFVGGMTAYVRTAADPAAFLPMLRQAVREVDANVPMYDLQTLRQQIDRSLLTERLLASLSTIFGLMATLLAAIGLYGVMAYTVSQRTREIGIRMALGAETSNVVWLVMREVLTLAAIGLAIGLPAAWACARLVQSQLFGVRASDPFTIALAILSIAAVALLAGYAPARRATSIDPVQALRWD